MFESFPYPSCILGTAYSPSSDEDLIVVYSRKLLYKALMSDGIPKDNVGDYIQFNIIYSPQTILLED